MKRAEKIKDSYNTYLSMIANKIRLSRHWQKSRINNNSYVFS